MAIALGHDRIGSGPPMVLLHPLGADRHVWDEVAVRLAGAHEVIAVDLPGFGESASLPPDRQPTPAALAAGVAGFLRDQGIEQPHVAGNSLGGWVALELGLAAEVNSVTAIAPAGLWPRPLEPKPGIARALSRAGLPLLGPLTRSRAGRRLLLAGAVARPADVAPLAAAQLVRAYATAPDFARVNAAMRGGVFGRLEELQVPVTLVWPQFDGLIARPRRLPTNVVNVELPGAGHIPMLEQPEAVAAVLSRASAATGSRRS